MNHRTGLGPAYRVENSTGLHILGPQVRIFWSIWFVHTCGSYHSSSIHRFTQLWRAKSWLLSAGKNKLVLKVSGTVLFKIQLISRDTIATCFKFFHQFPCKGINFFFKDSIWTCLKFIDCRCKSFLSGTVLELRVLLGGKKAAWCPLVPPWSTVVRWKYK